MRNKKMGRLAGEGTAPRRLGFIFLFLFFGLAMAGLYFVYAVVPTKVARAIVSKTSVREPLTQSPKDYQLSYKDVSYPTADGVTLSGWWMKPPGHKKILGTILLTHGLGHNRQQVLDRAAFLVKAGFQVLLFDLRGHGLSGDSPISGGLLESKDFSAGVRFLREEKDLRKPLIFFGFSLGAISALRAAVTDQDVVGVIADSPLANLRSYVSRRTLGGTFAGFPGFLGRCLAAYDRLTGLSLREVDLDLIPVVKELHSLPVLYITGELDDLARPEEIRDLFEKTDSKHRWLVYIPDAGHEETYKKYPTVYERSVLNFLTDLRKGFPKVVDSWSPAKTPGASK